MASKKARNCSTKSFIRSSANKGPAEYCRAFAVIAGASLYKSAFFSYIGEMRSSWLRNKPSTTVFRGGSTMRVVSIVLFLLFLSVSSQAEDSIQLEAAQPIEFEFGGYRFGQSPSANMVCFSGYCKSQAPGGDGRVTFPFSIYDTPGAVSTLAGLTVVNARYNFWEDQLYRVFFQVDCSPLSTEECLDDIVKSLDREFGLTPLSTSDSEYHVLQKRSVFKEFVLDSGALLKIRAFCIDGDWQMPAVDIVDKGVADRAGTSISPRYKPKKIQLPRNFGKAGPE